MREGIIRLWFDMWLQQEDLGIDKIFTEDILYIESWVPLMRGARWSSIGLKSGTPAAKS